MKENIIGGIFGIMHSASWADYIGYIGLTPYMDTQCRTILIYSNIPPPAVIVGAQQMVRLEKKLISNITLSHNSRCATYVVAREEANESSCKAVALCADVEVAKHKGTIAMVEEVVLKMAEVYVVVVGLRVD